MYAVVASPQICKDRLCLLEQRRLGMLDRETLMTDISAEPISQNTLLNGGRLALRTKESSVHVSPGEGNFVSGIGR